MAGLGETTAAFGMMAATIGVDNGGIRRDDCNDRRRRSALRVGLFLRSENC
jgi:hypothetical protein